MKRILISLVLLVTFSAIVQAQYPYAAIVWSQPKSPTTNNVLAPTTFRLYAALYQGLRSYPNGFEDSTDYGREYMFWADVNLKPNLNWQVVYYVPPFWMRDSLNGDWWQVSSRISVLQHGPGAGGVSGRIAWTYYH